MNENINLVEILKEHNGETFYSPLCGEIIYKGINTKHSFNCLHFVYEGQTHNRSEDYYLSKEGTLHINGECLVFPSKKERDWNKWFECNKFKTWDDYIKEHNIFYKPTIIINNVYDTTSKYSKSVIALYKIFFIIDSYYGGLITNEEWLEKNFKYYIEYHANVGYSINSHPSKILPISFHENKQAKQFLSKKENINLLNDYFMIN